jgi:hypothetical protein
MFNLFKKKPKIDFLQEFEVLRAISENLSEKYAFLKDQLNTNFILSTEADNPKDPYWRRIVYNQNLYDEYKNVSIDFLLKGIEVFDNTKNAYVEIELDFYEGILIRFRIPSKRLELNLKEIKITSLQEQRYEISEMEIKFKKILEDFEGKFEFDNGFVIELEDKSYYVIRDLEDGNYISIDKDHKVYGMFHDPYIIEQISPNIKIFIDKINRGLFSIENYYNNKF